MLKFSSNCIFSYIQLFTVTVSVFGQVPPQPRNRTELPPVSVSAHDIGKLVLGVSNKGFFGNSTLPIYYNSIVGNNHYVGCEYTKGSGISGFGPGSIWIGGILRGDTLVSDGFFGYHFEGSGHPHPPTSEFNPDDAPVREIQHLSTLKDSEYYDKSAVSHQDLISYYTDTIVSD